MISNDPPEEKMLKPVLTLFPKGQFERFVEVPLGRKRIDLLCVPHEDSDPQVSVELKIKDWRRAVWQAIVNLQLAERSYVAIWHTYQKRILRNRSLMEHYGIGLIIVSKMKAREVLPANERPVRVSRGQKRAFYEALTRV